MPHIRIPMSSLQRQSPVSRRVFRVTGLLTVLLTLTGCQATSNNSASGKRLIEVAKSYSVTKHESSAAPALFDWNTRIHPLFEQARHLVSEHTGVDLSDVRLNIASDNSITDEVGYETHRLIHSQFNDRNFANLFLDSVMRGQQGTYAALYATRKREVMISLPLMRSYQQSLPNSVSVQESAILALLIHELVHAADDKRYQIHENRDLNFRASFAQSAAFEGHAQFRTRQICSNAGCLPGLQALDTFMFGERNPPNSLTQTVQAVSRNVLEYSYVEGERFISALANRPDGQKLIDELLSNPPQDPIQILDPKSFPNNQREQRNQELIRISTNFDHPWLQPPWTSVQTSPLKGVNLRTDPTRRDAAVDGFTRLITSMVAVQLYDQSQSGLTPIELTVLRTESNDTANLFAKTLYENTRIKGATLVKPRTLVKVSGQSTQQPAMLYMSKEPAENNQQYYTLIGVSGTNVVQIAGLGLSETLFVDYVDQLLIKLEDIRTAALNR